MADSEVYLASTTCLPLSLSQLSTLALFTKVWLLVVARLLGSAPTSTCVEPTTKTSYYRTGTRDYEFTTL